MEIDKFEGPSNEDDTTVDSLDFDMSQVEQKPDNFKNEDKNKISVNSTDVTNYYPHAEFIAVVIGE